MNPFPANRLFVAFRLLALLPPKPTESSTAADICRELGIAPRYFFRLVADVKKAGFEIKKYILESNRVSYYLGRPTQVFVERVLYGK
jgi:hypothetical protein